MSVFLRAGQLRKRYTQLREIEERIKSKTAATLPFAGNHARTGSYRCKRVTIPPKDSGSADVLGTSAIIGDIPQLLEQQTIVVFIGVPGSDAVVGGETFGTHTRQPAQCIDRQAGVICQRRPTREVREIARLRPCVVDESVMRFDVVLRRLVRNPEIGKRHEPDGSHRSQDLDDFSGFVPAAGSEQDFSGQVQRAVA
jgi:hypothetical protein